LNIAQRSVEMGGPDGHESAADGQDAFDKSIGWGWQAGSDAVEGVESIAGGKVELGLTMHTGRGAGAGGQRERSSRKEKDKR
jgi:hypothetical protein